MKDLSAYVYITNHKIQVLLGGYVKNRVQVESFYEQELEEGTILNGMIMNSYSLQSSLSEMWKAHNLPTKSVYLTVNGSSITVKPIKIPQTVPKNVPGLIRTEFREMENIQNLLIDYSVINPKNADGSSSILAVLSTREFIMSYVDLFREAKIELGVIDLLQNCLIKLMRHLKSMQNKTYAIFMLDQSTMTQCLFTAGDFVMTRRSRILADPSDPEFEREIGQNINSMIQFQKSEQTGTDLTELYLCGFPAETQPLFERFSQNFAIQVQSFPAFSAQELALPKGLDPADFIVLLGSVIRYSI